MRSDTRQTYVERIQHAVEAALDRLDEQLDGTAMADAAGFSAFHFSRMFAGMLGESPGAFVRRLRLERAAYRLRNTEQPIGEAALEAGYEGPEAFTRAFRAAFYMSPTDYRRSELAHRLPTLSGVHFDPNGAMPVITPRDTGGTNMNVEIKENTPTWHLLALRHVGPYWQIGPAFGKLMQWAGMHQVPIAGPAVGIYYDDPDSVKESDLKSDAAVVVAPGYEPEGTTEVRALDLAGGRDAVYTHKGSYAGLGESWGRMYGEWFPNSGLEIDESRNTFEVYLNDCSQVSEAELLTELHIPVK